MQRRRNLGVFSQNPLVPEWTISDQYQEALLTEARNAIEETDNGECNAGFLRSNAMLHIILVSDEPEQSVDISGETWQQLADQIIAKRGSSGLVRISSIVGDVPNGCQSGGLFGAMRLRAQATSKPQLHQRCFSSLQQLVFSIQSTIAGGSFCFVGQLSS